MKIMLIISVCYTTYINLIINTWFVDSEKVKELLESETISEVIIAEKTNSFVRKLIYQVSWKVIYIIIIIYNLCMLIILRYIIKSQFETNNIQ